MSTKMINELSKHELVTRKSMPQPQIISMSSEKSIRIQWKKATRVFGSVQLRLLCGKYAIAAVHYCGAMKSSGDNKVHRCSNLLLGTYEDFVTEDEALAKAVDYADQFLSDLFS